MYVETDFLLALSKDDDWLGDAATQVCREHSDELWTSQFTLIELLLVAYREDRNAVRVVANAADFVDVRGDVRTVLEAANYVEEHGLTPFDALHLVNADGNQIVSSDRSYDEFTDRLALEALADED